MDMECAVTMRPFAKLLQPLVADRKVRSFVHVRVS